MADFHFAGGVQGHFLENVTGWISALEALRLAEPQHTNGTSENEIAASARRIAHVVGGSAGMYGYADVRRSAGALENASSATLGARLDDLIEALHDIAASDPDHKIRILVVEPDTDVSDLLDVMLSTPNREVIVATSAETARKALEEQDVSLITLALELPDADGRALLARLRERTRTTAVPIFVLSARRDAQIRTECFALGADAFFEKPFDPAALSSAVAVRLQRRASIQSKDPVTGLPDRTAFENAYERVQSVYSEGAHAERSRENRSPLCLAVLGLDHFEEISDVHGPAASQEALRHTADLLLRSLRDADLLARWGRGTFVALFPGTLLEDAVQVLDRAVQTVRQASVSTAASRARGGGLRLSCSAGLTRVRSADTPAGEAQRDAAYLLHLAQSKGGRRVETEQHVATPSKPSLLLVEDDELIATILQDRLEREGFEVDHYTNGLRAYEHAQEYTAALTLLDINLPGMNGFELLEKLRAMPAYARRPIIMLTAMTREDDVVRGFELGADDYILKPFSPAELVARVQHLLSTKSRA